MRVALVVMTILCHAIFVGMGWFIAIALFPAHWRVTRTARYSWTRAGWIVLVSINTIPLAWLAGHLANEQFFVPLLVVGAVFVGLTATTEPRRVYV
jgi:hypothetical protein